MFFSGNSAPNDTWTTEDPDTPDLDENWTIVFQNINTTTTVDGETNAIEMIRRREPLSGTPANAPNVNCTFQASESDSLSSSFGGVKQTVKIFFYRYLWIDNNNVHQAFWIYKTKVTWKRTNVDWGVGQATLFWEFLGLDCSNVSRNYLSGNPIDPQWKNGGLKSYRYVSRYTDHWAPIYGNLDTELTTPVYYKNAYKGSAYLDLWKH